MHSQQLFLSVPTIEVGVAGHQQELDVLRIHRDILRSFVGESPVVENKRD